MLQVTNVSQTTSLLGALLVVNILAPLHNPLIQPLAVVNTKHLHPLVVLQVRQKLGCDQEVLCRIGLACLFNQLRMHQPLIALIKYIIQ